MDSNENNEPWVVRHAYWLLPLLVLIVALMIGALVWWKFRRSRLTSVPLDMDMDMDIVHPFPVRNPVSSRRAYVPPSSLYYVPPSSFYSHPMYSPPPL